MCPYSGRFSPPTIAPLICQPLPPDSSNLSHSLTPMSTGHQTEPFGTQMRCCYPLLTHLTFVRISPCVPITLKLIQNHAFVEKTPRALASMVWLWGSPLAVFPWATPARHARISAFAQKLSASTRLTSPPLFKGSSFLHMGHSSLSSLLSKTLWFLCVNGICNDSLHPHCVFLWIPFVFFLILLFVIS